MNTKNANEINAWLGVAFIWRVSGHADPSDLLLAMSALTVGDQQQARKRLFLKPGRASPGSVIQEVTRFYS
jgi:hypothetical protein